jgi:NADH-quinone oxidoreductase subunit H
MRFAMFFLAEYFHMITGAAFFSVLFLGGWSLNPIGGSLDLPMQGGLPVALLQVGVMLGKVTLMVAFAMAIRWTLPRFRFDQLMKLAWEGMIPTALLMLLITAAFTYFGWTGSIWAGSLLCVAAVYLLGPMLPRQKNPNQRIGIVGSRFSPLVEGTGSVSTHPVALDDSAIPDRRQGLQSIH